MINKKYLKKRCIEEKIYDSYEIHVDYKNRDKDDFYKDPYILYLTKKQSKDNLIALKNKKKYTIKFSGYHFKKICREVLNRNSQFNNLIIDILYKEKKFKKKNYIPTYSLPKRDWWTLPPSKKVKLYKKPTKKTITIGVKKRAKDFMKKFEIKKK